MKNSRSVRFAVRMGMMLALLAAGSLRAQDSDGFRQEGSLGPSDRGYTPGTSFNAVAGVEIQPRNLSLS